MKLQEVFRARAQGLARAGRVRDQVDPGSQPGLLIGRPRAAHCRGAKESAVVWAPTPESLMRLLDHVVPTHSYGGKLKDLVLTCQPEKQHAFSKCKLMGEPEIGHSFCQEELIMWLIYVEPGG